MKNFQLHPYLKIVSIIMPKCLIHPYPTHNLGFNTRNSHEHWQGRVKHKPCLPCLRSFLMFIIYPFHTQKKKHAPLVRRGYPMHASSKGSRSRCFCFTYSTEVTRSSPYCGDGGCCLSHVGVSKNRGTPKWMVYNGKPY